MTCELWLQRAPVALALAMTHEVVAAASLEGDTLRVSALPGIDVHGIAYDSRHVQPGDVFVALEGAEGRREPTSLPMRSRGVPWPSLPISRRPRPPGAVGRSCPTRGQRWLRWLPSSTATRAVRWSVVGITGTNGKTTTAYLLRAIFEAAGKKCGLIGTVTYSNRRRAVPASRTTPEAPDVQRMFRQMVDAGCGACVMEVSSHALALRRVDETRFAAGVFTNLTRDHLDYHGDMESYFSAKKRLFEMLPPERRAAINIDDPRGETLRKTCLPPGDVRDQQAGGRDSGTAVADIRGPQIRRRARRSGTVHVKSRLVGRPNVSNILATVAAATALDLPVAAIERGLPISPVCLAGSKWCRARQDDITVVIDYAHTDDALKNLLETARPLAEQRVITVFGCGGDRDRTKRPLMGAVAARLSDVVVITSDNPRTEDPVSHHRRDQAGRAGSSRSGDATSCVTIVDRKEAIQFAVKQARPGDLVLLAGKGHEKTQIIGSRELPFDEAEIARRGAGAETLTPACHCRRRSMRTSYGPGGKREIDRVFDRHVERFVAGDFFIADSR